MLPAELTNLAVKLFSKGNGSDRSSEGEIEKKGKKKGPLFCSGMAVSVGKLGLSTGLVY